MKGRERRQERRVAVSRRATLVDGATSSPCLLQDISTGGFFIISNQTYFVGQVLELKCELYPDRILHCKIATRRGTARAAPCAGARSRDR